MCHRLKKPSTASRNTIDRLKSGAVAALLIVGTTGTAWGQFLCSSDNQVAPAALAERFISADCAFCWRQPVPVPKSASGLTLDWIVPGALGDEAPLSAAANRDALVRLESLDLAAPQTQRLVHQVVDLPPEISLRVAHGLVLGGYVGASISLSFVKTTQTKLPLHAWLVLVEHLPAGTEGSPTPRILARNMLQPIWNIDSSLQNNVVYQETEMRPMNIPAGTNTANIGVVGWVSDHTGKILVAAQSACSPDQ